MIGINGTNSSSKLVIFHPSSKHRRKPKPKPPEFINDSSAKSSRPHKKFVARLPKNRTTPQFVSGTISFLPNGSNTSAATIVKATTQSAYVTATTIPTFVQKLQNIAKSRTILYSGAGILSFVVFILAISFVVHFSFSKRKHMKLIKNSKKANCYISDGEGMVILRGSVYHYRQSNVMVDETNSPTTSQRYRYWVGRGHKTFIPKRLQFIKRRASLWLPNERMQKRGSSHSNLLRGKSFSHFDLVSPHNRSRSAMEMDSMFTEFNSNFPGQLPYDISQSSEDRARSYYRDLLAEFQWQLQSATESENIDELVEKYAEQCFAESCRTFSLSGVQVNESEFDDVITSLPSSSEWLHQDSLQRPASRFNYQSNLTFPDYRAVSAVRNYRQSETRLSRDRLKPCLRPKRGEMIWKSVIDFFSPDPRRSRRNPVLDPYGIHQEQEVTYAPTGATSARLMFGKMNQSTA